MGQKEKLLERLYSIPKDFTFEEAESLLKYFGYCKSSKGKTSGSRVMFINENLGLKVLLHKPHPRNELKEYQVKQLAEYLKKGMK